MRGAVLCCCAAGAAALQHGARAPTLSSTAPPLRSSTAAMPEIPAGLAEPGLKARAGAVAKRRGAFRMRFLCVLRGARMFLNSRANSVRRRAGAGHGLEVAARLALRPRRLL